MLLYKTKKKVGKANIGSKFKDPVESLNDASLFMPAGEGDEFARSNVINTQGFISEAEKSTGEKVTAKNINKVNEITTPGAGSIKQRTGEKIAAAMNNFKNILPVVKNDSVLNDLESAQGIKKESAEAKKAEAGQAKLNSKMAVATTAAGMATGLLNLVDDGDDENYSDGEMAADVGKSVIGGAVAGMAMGATFGSVVPGLGTAIGAVVGLAAGAVTGIIKKKKYEKEAIKRDLREDKKNALVAKQNIARLGENVKRNARNLYSAELGGNRKGSYGTLYAYRGGGIMEREKTFRFEIEHVEGGSVKKVAVDPKEPVMSFKIGGKIRADENIIPNGVLHEEENSLGDKGMPVVKCKEDVCTKQYEIEKDELILTLKATEKIESLVEKDDIVKLGEFVKDELIKNTHSYTEKFKELHG